MEELDLFFEYEKHDTLDEFILNFEPFILGYENKDEIISYLIKLFSLQNKELKNLMIKKKCKKIINYLISERKKLNKTKITNQQYSKSFEVKESKTVKKQKVRKEFSEGVISLARLLLGEENIFDYLEKNMIDEDLVNQLLSYFRTCTNQLIHRKIELRSINQYSLIDEVQSKLKRCKKVSRGLILYKNRIQCEKYEKSNDEFFEILKGEVHSLLQQLKIAEDKTAVLSNIINLYQTYLQKEKEKYRTLINQRMEIINSLSENHASHIEEIKKEYFLQLAEVEARIKFLANKYNYYVEYSSSCLKLTNKDKNVQFQEEIQLSSIQENIKDDILQGKDIDGFEFTDVLYVLGDCIKHEDVNQYLLHYAREITTKLIDEEIKDDLVINAIYYVWDAIKYRLSTIPKNETDTRKIFKNIRQMFDFAIQNYQESEHVQQHDYLFNLINYFLGQEDCYLYLKKIVEVMPKVVNVRYTNIKNKVSEHVVIYIIDQFIENYKIMLYHHKKDYINKDYLKSVYFLFTRCYMLYLTAEEKKLIDRKLSDFMKEVNKSITSSKRKYAVKEDLKDMYTDKFYMNQKVNKLEYVDEYDLDNHLNSFFLSVRDTLKFSKNRVNCSKEMTFTLGSGYHAYSIKKEDDGFVLKVHVIDLYPLIPIPSLLSKYIFNQTATNSSIDNMIIRRINMKREETYPTITYEIRFDENGNYKDKNNRIKDLQVYLSKIKVNQKYSDYDLIYSNKENEFKLCMELYKKSLIRSNGQSCNQYLLEDVENHFERILNQGVVEYFDQHQLPFIYSGVYHYSEKDSVYIMNNVGYILSRLDRKEFNQIHQALSGSVDSFHYSTEGFDGEYQLSIMNPLNYSGLLIQKELHELVLENRFSEDEYERIVKKFRNKFDEVVARLNYQLDYVDPNVLQNNKGKLVKVKQMFL